MHRAPSATRLSLLSDQLLLADFLDTMLPPLSAAAQPIEVEAAPVKKGKNVKSWPTLGEAPKVR
jgi:hypothetical protein